MNYLWKKTLTHCTDEVLMQKISHGNAHAFEVLYDRYSAVMHRFFYRMLRQNTELCADFTQDVFLKIIENPQLFDTNRSFKTWIYAVATNKCKNAYRDRKETENVDNQIFEYIDNFEFDVDNQNFLIHFEKAINELDLSVKQCFVLRYLEDLSVKDIALVVGIPEGTVKSRLHNTAKKLATELAWCREILE
jgi:RNA polymerase sigma-70 factor, ECF subfamily